VICLPDHQFIVYDAGSDSVVVKKALGPLLKDPKSEIELLILSHTDSDHWEGAEHIMKHYKVKKVLKTDYRQGKYSGGYEKGIAAMRAKKVGLLKCSDLKPKDTLYHSGHVTLQFMCGFDCPLPEWKLSKSDKAVLNNCVSIVVKLTVKEHTVLFCGDAVGKQKNYSAKKCRDRDQCMATEKYLVEKVGKDLQAEVMIAPHHGADNASSSLFIQHVNPEFVVFSCGDMYEHPNQTTVLRYLDQGVKPGHIYRTDLCDAPEAAKMPCNSEWEHLHPHPSAGEGHTDDISIHLTPGKPVKIQYVEEKKN
jgi:beta-lactamase superfamily II metal-dependent hydrolase